MTHTYQISGMTCGNCVAKVKSELLRIGDVSSAEVQLTAPQATITMEKHIPLQVLQDAISKAGKYSISEDGMMHEMEEETPGSWWQTYKPILLIGLYITGATLLVETLAGSFDLHRWMANFMAGFFLSFSFFKLLDLQGFADSYSTYDVVARKWKGWGFVYPFIELVLGLAFLLRFNLLVTNGATFVVMSVSIIGVLQSVLNKKKIRCACLGSVFNLPMSTITIIEDALMIVMSAFMLMTAL